ncbi:MAG: YtxH domain-containing protein [Chloroflexi bacterium]|nr:MAG: YtxH domain-containing protein [Chloroflexota bacterium]
MNRTFTSSSTTSLMSPPDRKKWISRLSPFPPVHRWLVYRTFPQIPEFARVRPDRRALPGHVIRWLVLLMGYMRGLTHGAIAGAILALLYAPDSGVNTRRRVSRLLGQAEAMLSSDSGAAAGSAATPRRRAAGGTESKVRRP